jgi:hypothetical protein
MRQYGEKPNGGDGEVLSIGMALREGWAVDKKNGNGNCNVKTKAQRDRMQETMEFAHYWVRGKAEINLAEKIKTMDSPCPKCQVGDQ